MLYISLICFQFIALYEMYLIPDVCIFQSSLSSKERRQLQEDLGQAQAQLSAGRGAGAVRKTGILTRCIYSHKCTKV